MLTELLLSSVVQVGTDTVQNSLAVQHLDLQSYMLLYVPAVDWIMQCIAYKASEVRTPTHTATTCVGTEAGTQTKSVLNTVQPLNKGHFGTSHFVLVKRLSSSQMLHELYCYRKVLKRVFFVGRLSDPLPNTCVPPLVRALNEVLMK